MPQQLYECRLTNVRRTHATHHPAAGGAPAGQHRQEAQPGAPAGGGCCARQRRRAVPARDGLPAGAGAGGAAARPGPGPRPHRLLFPPGHLHQVGMSEWLWMDGAPGCKGPVEAAGGFLAAGAAAGAARARMFPPQGPSPPPTALHRVLSLRRSAEGRRRVTAEIVRTLSPAPEDDKRRGGAAAATAAAVPAGVALAAADSPYSSKPGYPPPFKVGWFKSLGLWAWLRGWQGCRRLGLARTAAASNAAPRCSTAQPQP